MSDLRSTPTDDSEWTSSSASRRFTLKDLFLAMTCLGMFMALALVYIPHSRDEVRGMRCSNNLKQIGLALHNYHDTYLSFPIGSRGAGDTTVDPTATQDYAASWYVQILEFNEQRGVADLWDDEAGNGFDGGANPRNSIDLVNGFVPDWLRCPISPLPELVLVGKHGTPEGRVLPTYTGIAGGVTQLDWRYHDPTRMVDQNGNAVGILASNGLLLANEAVRIKDIRDGTSNTMFVGEQSDYHLLGNQQIMIHSGGLVGAWCGAEGNGVVGQSATATNPTAWNLTTVRYPAQTKRHKNRLPAGMFGPSDTNYLGNNNGIFSAHKGGAQAAFADGRVRFLADDIDLEVLVYMCIRDDGIFSEQESDLTSQ